MLFQNYLLTLHRVRNGEFNFEEAPPPEPCSDGQGGLHKPPPPVCVAASSDDDDSPDGDHPSNDHDPLAPFRGLLRDIAATAEIYGELKRSSKSEREE